MKNVKFLFLSAVAVLCLVSCGGGDVITASKKVNGPLGKYFEVVERDYCIKDGTINVEFRRIAKGGPTEASWDTHPTFNIELQDENGNMLKFQSTDVVRSKEQLEAVFSLGIGETTSITFSFDKTKNAAKFKITSKWKVTPKPQKGTPGDFPQASDRLLTDEDLSSMSRADLKIMRNEIYARHGYIFKTAAMKAHFKGLPWYKGKYADVSSMLTDIENRNVALIQKYE